ncbi:MAG: hypothetical protein WDW36_004240 [Sanguina aurantia]
MGYGWMSFRPWASWIAWRWCGPKPGSGWTAVPQARSVWTAPTGGWTGPLLKRKLLEKCVANGVTFLNAKVDSVSHADGSSTVKAADGRLLRGSLVLDATGHSRKLVEYDQPFNPGYQGAYGIMAEVESHPFPLDTMLFMDWRDDHLTQGTDMQAANAATPTFLYAMPFTATKVFLEETSLVARPAVGFKELKERLEIRLKSMGIKVTRVEEEEYCLIPMGGVLPRHPQRVLALGGTAGMVHPSTGFMVARTLGAAPTVADAIIDQLSSPSDKANTAGVARMPSSEAEANRMASAVWAAIWPLERIRQRSFFTFGMDVLLKLDLKQTREFFSAFFSLSKFHWHGFLSTRLSFTELLGFGIALFLNASNSARANLLVQGVPGLIAMLAGLLPTLRDDYYGLKSLRAVKGEVDAAAKATRSSSKEDEALPHYIGKIKSAFVDSNYAQQDPHCIEVFELGDTDINPIGCISGKCAIIKARTYEEAVSVALLQERQEEWYFCRGYFLQQQNTFQPYTAAELVNPEAPPPPPHPAGAASHLMHQNHTNKEPPPNVQPLSDDGDQDFPLAGHGGGRSGSAFVASQPAPLPQQQQQHERAHSQEGDGGSDAKAAVAAAARKKVTGRVCAECNATTTPQWREGPAGGWHRPPPPARQHSHRSLLCRPHDVAGLGPPVEADQLCLLPAAGRVLEVARVLPASDQRLGPKTLCNACGVRYVRSQQRAGKKAGGNATSKRDSAAAAGERSGPKGGPKSSPPTRNEDVHLGYPGASGKGQPPQQDQHAGGSSRPVRQADTVPAVSRTAAAAYPQPPPPPAISDTQALPEFQPTAPLPLPIPDTPNLSLASPALFEMVPSDTQAAKVSANRTAACAHP